MILDSSWYSQDPAVLQNLTSREKTLQANGFWNYPIQRNTKIHYQSFNLRHPESMNCHSVPSILSPFTEQRPMLHQPRGHFDRDRDVPILAYRWWWLPCVVSQFRCGKPASWTAKSSIHFFCDGHPHCGHPWPPLVDDQSTTIYQHIDLSLVVHPTDRK